MKYNNYKYFNHLKEIIKFIFTKYNKNCILKTKGDMYGRKNYRNNN